MPLLGARVGVAGAVVAAGRDWTLPVLGRGDILGNILGNQSGFVAEGVTSLHKWPTGCSGAARLPPCDLLPSLKKRGRGRFVFDSLTMGTTATATATANLP